MMRRTDLAVAAALGFLVLPLAAVPAGAGSLRAEIQSLAKTHDFQVSGLGTISEDEAPKVEGSLTDRLSRLLDDYNFVIVRGGDGNIVQITVAGTRTAPAAVAPRLRPRPRARSRAVPAARRGREHYVTTHLTGPSGKNQTLRLMVDTGASTLVLPTTYIAALGFSAADLKDVRMQTANGVTTGKFGLLKNVRVGTAKAQRVAVAFVPAGHLGGKGLLGMSFLGRFRMTIDASAGELRLENNK